MEKRKYKKNFLLESRRERIKSMYLEGYTLKEIMQEVDASFYSISDYLKKEGLLKKIKVLDEDALQKLVIKLFKEGNSSSEIAYTLKTSAILVISMLKKSNLIKNKYFYGGRKFDKKSSLLQYKKEVAINVRRESDKGKNIIRHLS